MARPEPREEVLGSVDVHVDEASRRDERAGVVEQERAVQLRELLDRLPQLGAGHVEEVARVSIERVEQEGTRLVEDVVDVPDHEERADLASFSPFTRQLDRELDDLLQRLAALVRTVRALADHPEGGVERSSARVLSHTLFNERSSGSNPGSA